MSIVTSRPRRIALGWGLLGMAACLTVVFCRDLLGTWDRNARGLATFLAVSAAAGSLLVWSGRRKRRREDEISAHGRLATGAVDDLEPSALQMDEGAEPLWVMRYMYRDHEGTKREGKALLPQRAASRWRRGDAVRVRFDPAAPDRSVWVAEPAPAERAPASVAEPSLWALFKRTPSIVVGPLLVVSGWVRSLPANASRLGPIAFVAAGLVAFALGARRIRGWRRLLRAGVPAEGVVLRVAATGLGSSDWAWRIRYAYGEDGARREGESGYLPQTEGFGVAVGDKCRLRVDPADPRRSVWIGRT